MTEKEKILCVTLMLKGEVFEDDDVISHSVSINGAPSKRYPRFRDFIKKKEDGFAYHYERGGWMLGYVRWKDES